MHAQNYINAVYTLLGEGKSFDVVCGDLRTMLAKHGHNALYPKILRGLITEFNKRTAHDAITVRFAREKDIEKYHKEITELLAAQNLSTTYNTAIETSLIGGFTIQQKDKRVDQSHKRHLLEIYRALIG